ncbi:MAG: CBS domain-containing protein [Anaerolineae bacterium]|nr:CBS domain-containing protein [Anaerolineae bacterium]
MRQGLVKNWMTGKVITTTPATHLNDARLVMDAENIRSLPVVQDGKLVGIVTYRGLLRTDVSALSGKVPQKGVDFKNYTIEDVMTRGVITTLPQAAMPKAARVMMENKITALPVMERDQLVGILTSSDLFRFILGEIDTLNEQITVKNYMTREVVTLAPQDSLLEAHRLMGVKRIRTLPVIDNGKLIGIVTRTDLMGASPSRFVSRNHQDDSLLIEQEKIERIMSTRLITIKEDANITEAARLMLENKIHSLPVVDDKGEMIGVITEYDLFQMIVQKFF